MIPNPVQIHDPAHPGEVLRDYLGGMTLAEAAGRLGITRTHLSRILNGRAGITASMSLRLSAALGTSADFWLRMQVQRDLWLAQKERRPKIRPFPHVAVLGGLPQVTESCEAKSF